MARKRRMDKLEKAKAEGKVIRIRTIKPTPDTYMHIGVLRGRESAAEGPSPEG